MPESNHDDLVTRIEAMIEQGALDEARRLIEGAMSLHGARPELDELRRRLGVVESTLSERGLVEAAIRRAREEMNRADYPSALDVLEKAIHAAPEDASLREMLNQTTRAALRHEAAVERNRAVVVAVERIGGLLARGRLEEAMAEMREANLTFGKHKALLALQERLDVLWREAELEKTVAFVDQARAFLDGEKWSAAQEQAERVLRADPQNEEALTVKRRAQVALEREAARKHADLDVEAARQDVERLILAGEVAGANRSLQEAIDRLGRHEAFEALGRQLDQAKAELQAKKRFEWNQRRLKEAEDLVRQAGRSSLQGQYEEAIRRLHQARELHPDHPEIEGMLQAAQAAEERNRLERRRSEALQAAKLEIRQLLDALRLSDAAVRLQVARGRFEDDTDFQDLAIRLQRLREAESAGQAPAAPKGVDPRTEAEALERQRALASAYSWKQALLFTFRGEGVKIFWGALILILGLETLAAWVETPIVLGVLRWLVSVAVLGWLLPIVRETFLGHGTFPASNELTDLKSRAVDIALTLGMLVAAAAPLVVWTLARGWHGLFAGPTGWWCFVVLLWLASAFFVTASGAAGSFGYRNVPRIVRHARGVRVAAPELCLVVNFVFGLTITVMVLRAILVPYIPWMGAPLAAIFEVYGLLTAPHLIGVAIRRHRIELVKVYQW